MHDDRPPDDPTPNPLELHLEALLKLATEHPSRRPEFYRSLLDANVYVLLEGGSASGRTTAPAGSDISVVTWTLADGGFAIPFFTSVARIREATHDWYDAVKMTGRDLFEAARGQILHLNPQCQYGRAFTPSEIDVLLQTGTIARMSAEITQETRSIVLEEAEALPEAALTALVDLYGRSPSTRAAYLVRFRDPQRPALSTLVIALESDDEEESIMADTATILGEPFFHIDGVDLLFIRSTGGGLEQGIVKHIRPFYERKI